MSLPPIRLVLQSSLGLLSPRLRCGCVLHRPLALLDLAGACDGLLAKIGTVALLSGALDDGLADGAGALAGTDGAALRRLGRLVGAAGNLGGDGHAGARLGRLDRDGLEYCVRQQVLQIVREE